MNGKGLRDRIQELHHAFPRVLEGRLSPDQFWSDVEAWFQELEQASTAFQQILPGHDMVPCIQALRETLRWDLEFNRQLFLAIQNRVPEDTMPHHLVSVLEIMSGDIVDRFFNRLTVLAEILGVLDGTVEFPMVSYMVYQELRAIAQALYLTDEESLEA